jgi:hypothetical protein
MSLSLQEHELRLRKLNRQLAELSAAYVHSREPDVQKTGDSSHAHIDIKDAEKKLNEFVIIDTLTIQTNQVTEEERQ